MIQHYFKVAWRNLLRYKTQSIISIVGLAVGFACFALATLWLRYEMTYDGFHEGSNRIYQLSRKSTNVVSADRADTDFPVPLATDLKLHFPEIESACAVIDRRNDYILPDGTPVTISELSIDSCFLNMFHVRLLNGSMDFLNNDDQIALSETSTYCNFGLDSPLGKEYKSSDNNSKKTVVALVSGWGKHSNISFDALRRFDRKYENDWSYSPSQVWIKLKRETDVASFGEKLYAYQSKPDRWGEPITRIEMTPITQSRHQLYPWKISIEFQYLVLFCIAGALVIVCALFNYLSLFANRLRMRVREMALRKVCGSSNLKLFALLSTEFTLVLLLACALGMAIIELVLPAFQKFTGVTGSVYGESLLYFAALMLLAMLTFLLVVYYFNKRLLQRTLKGSVDKQKQPFFYRSSMVLQMLIGILFVFCICVITKQMNHLRHADIGMERKNIAIIQTYNGDKITVATEILRQMPLLTEVVEGAYPLFPQPLYLSRKFVEWEGKQPTDEPISIEELFRGDVITKFYKLRLLKGEFFSDSTDNTNKVLLNETAVKLFGWSDPIGKKIDRYTVIGVIKDVHKTSPTTLVVPVIVTVGEGPQLNWLAQNVLIKYGDHAWETVQDSIRYRLTKDIPDMQYNLINVEEEYEKFLKSETVFLKLLSIVAVVCVLISAFGIYSFVTLTCERRRKEIAIRKVNGARVSDVLLIFLKEYTVLLVLASAIAFSVGYALMKRWLESYVEQTAISWWVYGAVFAGIACVVLLSIWTRVWKAANQNPAEVIKSE